jgi:hypothetical protein
MGANVYLRWTRFCGRGCAGATPARGDGLAADQRDCHASDRDKEACREAEELDALFWQARCQIREHFAGIQDITIDPAEWPDLIPAALAHLRAHAAEQRRLAEFARAAVASLLDDLRNEIHHNQANRLAAVRDRRAAARDRGSSACERDGSAEDRDLSARDRGQAAIEREQADPADVSEAERVSTTQAPLTDPVARAVAECQQRIADSRNQLTRTRGHANSTASMGHDSASSSPDG